MQDKQSIVRVFRLTFNSNPYEARQQVTALSKVDAFKQLFNSLSDSELAALVSVQIESETPAANA